MYFLYVFTPVHYPTIPLSILTPHLSIYETKGLSLEQVDELYAKTPKAWNSKAFRPTVNFVDVQELGAGEARRSTLADLETNAYRRKSSAGVHQEMVNEKY